MKKEKRANEDNIEKMREKLGPNGNKQEEGDEEGQKRRKNSSGKEKLTKLIVPISEYRKFIPKEN